MAIFFDANLFIVSAPSGGGKTSLVSELVSSLHNIETSISHTTRGLRPGEQHGFDYFFIDEQQFTKMIQENAFIEHACVFNAYYGTSKAQIESRLTAGIDVVLDIDWQGAQQIKRLFPSAVSIFIVPPSLNVLQQRLLARRRDDKEIIQQRMEQARGEISHYAEFDYLIINDSFQQAAANLQAIVVANRLHIDRQRIKEEKLLSLLL